MLPILRVAKEEIEKEKTGVFCSIETTFQVGQKPVVVFTCTGGPPITNLDAKPISVSATFESNGKAVFGRAIRRELSPEFRIGWCAPVKDAESVIETTIKDVLDSYHKLRVKK